MSAADDAETAQAEYAEIKPQYEKLAEEVLRVLKSELATAKVSPVSIIHRAKDIESYTEKISRKKYVDPLSETTDLAGVRVVCTYSRELAKIEEIIKANFKVKEVVDKALELGVDRMGYNGKAYVVVLGNRYAGGVYKGITDLTCEIQVRTILQDAWAIIDHKLVYKNKESTPKRLRRDLNNVASLLEIAQGIFDTFSEKRAAYVAEIQQKEPQPSAFLAQPLDFDTVMAYAKWKFPDREPSERLTQLLLRDINLPSYPTLRELDAVVERTKQAVEAYSQENPEWFKNGTDFLTKSLGFGDAEFRAKHGFAARTRNAFKGYKHLVRD